MNGDVEHVAHAWKHIGLLGETFVTFLDLIKCLKLVKEEWLILACPRISELPSNMCIVYTMIHSYKIQSNDPIKDLYEMP